MADETKTGKRHSSGDQKLIDRIHADALALGATPPDVMPPMDDGKSAPDIVFNGSSVKALGDGRVGGYLVMFGDAKTPDLTGDYFTALTDFGTLETTPILYHHGLDAKIGQRVLGDAKLKRDDVGVWLDGQLNLRDEYEKAIYGMVENNKAGWSSGTASHLVERKSTGKASHITRWPLGLDASITPTPAEPRTHAMTLKSLTTVQSLDTILKAGDAMGAAASGQTFKQETKNMADETANKSADVDALRTSMTTLTQIVTDLAASVKTLTTTPAPDKSGYVATGQDGIKANIRVASEEAPFKRSGDFFKAVQAHATNSLSEEQGNRLFAAQKAAVKATGLSEQVGTDGGFLVQTDVSSKWLERMYTTGNILSRVSRDTISSASNGMTFYGVNETSRVNGSRFGGVQGYWVGEAGAITKSTPQFRRFDLKLNKVAALVYATDEQLSDTPMLEGFLNRVVPQELQFKTEDAIVNGDGVGKPKGILNAQALVTQAAEGGQIATTFTLANAVKMRGRLWLGARENAAYFCNQDVEQQIFQMQVGSFPVYMSPGSAKNEPVPSRLLGFPVFPTEYNQTLGTVGDVIMADLSQYQVIDKGGVNSAASIHVQFLTDETAFRFIYRVDGAPAWQNVLTPFKGANTLSPFIALAAR